MFTDLANFGLKRTPVQAFGFYIAYLVITITVAALFGFVVGALELGFLEDRALAIGGIIGAFLSAVITYLVLRDKKMLKFLSAILYIIVAFGLGLLGGGVLGLILPSYLTTRNIVT